MGALLTGARYGELIEMTVADFHADSGTIHVPFTKQVKPHTIHLDNKAVTFFEGMVAKAKGRLIFTRAGEKWGHSWQARPMGRLAGGRASRPPLAIHALRHTWASLAVMNGMNIKVVAENLGHADTRMVELHYGHLAPSFKSEQVRKHSPDYGFAADGVVTPLRRAAKGR